jgi:hypothetical protein
MFNPSQADVRNFFFTLVEKVVSSQQSLSEIEKIAYSVVLEHPEYQSILTNRVKYLNYQWTSEVGQVNPFLHLSLHLTVLEQLSIDQPGGIKNLYIQLCNILGDRHQAEHQLMDCITEMLYQAQLNHQSPKQQVYFDCINKKLGSLL